MKTFREFIYEHADIFDPKRQHKKDQPELPSPEDDDYNPNINHEDDENEDEFIPHFRGSGMNSEYPKAKIGHKSGRLAPGKQPDLKGFSIRSPEELDSKETDEPMSDEDMFHTLRAKLYAGELTDDEKEMLRILARKRIKTDLQHGVLNKKPLDDDY